MLDINNKFHRKYIRRMQIRAGVCNRFRGKQKFIHDGIGLRARIATNPEATKDMIWRCNALPHGKGVRYLNSATIFQLYRIFPYTDIREVQ